MALIRFVLLTSRLLSSKETLYQKVAPNGFGLEIWANAIIQLVCFLCNCELFHFCTVNKSKQIFVSAELDTQKQHSNKFIQCQLYAVTNQRLVLSQSNPISIDQMTSFYVNKFATRKLFRRRQLFNLCIVPQKVLFVKLFFFILDKFVFEVMLFLIVTLNVFTTEKEIQ